MTAWWRFLSLRTRLTLWYACALTAVMAAYGGFVYLYLERSLSAELDRQIAEEIEAAESGLERVPGEALRWRSDPGHPPEKEHAASARVEVLSKSGALIHRGSEFDDRPPMRVRERICMVEGEEVRIRVAHSEEGMQHELRELLVVLGLGLPLGVGAAAAGGYLLARRALAPVAEMASMARTITAENLSARLPIENPRDEMGRLAAVFNDTLARLESSFGQLRRFTADASHELRTPLTALRAVGEVGLREPRDPAAYREMVGSMLEEVDRLTRLVENLLLLSRADAGQMSLAPERVDLAQLAREVASLLGVLAEERRQTIAVEVRAAARPIVDRAILRQAVINLLDNAIKHGPEAATIRMVVDSCPDGAVLEVVDTGPGIPQEHVEKVFDRFYRVDSARSRESGGAGLGLSIARWAVEASGGRIEVRSEVGNGSTFRIVLPSSGGNSGGGISCAEQHAGS